MVRELIEIGAFLITVSCVLFIYEAVLVFLEKIWKGMSKRGKSKK